MLLVYPSTPGLITNVARPTRDPGAESPAVPGVWLRTGSVRYAVEALTRGMAQLGSALRSGRRGPGFKSRQPDHVVVFAVSVVPVVQFRLPSSSGLGHRPFKAAARVRIPLGVLQYFWGSGSRGFPLRRLGKRRFQHRHFSISVPGVPESAETAVCVWVLGGSNSHKGHRGFLWPWRRLLLS